MRQFCSIDKFLFLIVVIFSSCSANKKVSDSDTVAVAETLSEDDQIKELVNRWNQTLNDADPSAIELYADRVKYYTAERTARQIVDGRVAAVKKDRRFSQLLMDDISLTKYPNGLIRAKFTKMCTDKSGMHEYPAYLVFQKFGDTWKIIKESDKVTDDNIEAREREIADSIEAMKSYNEWEEEPYEPESYPTPVSYTDHSRSASRAYDDAM